MPHFSGNDIYAVTNGPVADVVLANPYSDVIEDATLQLAPTLRGEVGSISNRLERTSTIHDRVSIYHWQPRSQDALHS